MLSGSPEDGNRQKQRKLSLILNGPQYQNIEYRES